MRSFHNANSFHCLEQGLVCAPLCVLRVRHEDDTKIEILRVRREAGVQKVL